MSSVLQTEKYKIGPFAPIQIFRAKNSGLTNPLDGKRQTAIVNRLATQFHKLDKAKLRVLKEIDHEKQLWTRHLRSLTADADGASFAESTNNYTSADLIETDEGKVVPPGFRFKSNGDIRIPSQTLQALQKIATQANDIRRDEDVKSSADEQAQDSFYMDDEDEAYEKEIQRLENAIFRICQSLSLGKVHLYKEPQKQQQNETCNVTVQDFDYTEAVGDSAANDEAVSPNGKNPQQALRVSSNHPRQKICIGCNMKLRHACSYQIKQSLQRAKTFDAKQKRWNYVPRGRYVPPSLLNRRHNKQDAWTETPAEAKPATQPSRKHPLFGMEQSDPKKLPSVEIPSAMSKHGLSKTSMVSKSPMLNSLPSKSQTIKSASTDTQTTKLNKTKSQKTKSARFATESRTPKPPTTKSSSKSSELHVSNLGQVFSSTRSSPAAVTVRRKTSKSGRITPFDHEAFNHLMKVAQVEEQDICDKKVKVFLRSLPRVLRYQ